MGCIFCDILDGKREGHILYKDDSYASFLDRYPIDTGHALVVPSRHYELITDMEPDCVGGLFSLATRIARAVLDAAGADAFSMAQNNGRAAKQIVPHVHVHIIPRYNHRGTVWSKRRIASDAELSELAARIRRSLDSVSP